MEKQMTPQDSHADVQVQSPRRPIRYAETRIRRNTLIRHVEDTP